MNDLLSFIQYAMFLPIFPCLVFCFFMRVCFWQGQIQGLRKGCSFLKEGISVHP